MEISIGCTVQVPESYILCCAAMLCLPVERAKLMAERGRQSHNAIILIHWMVSGGMAKHFSGASKPEEVVQSIHLMLLTCPRDWVGSFLPRCSQAD